VAQRPASSPVAARILPSGPAPHPGGRERVSICSSARIGRWWSIASRGRDDEGDGGAGGGGGAELDLCSCRRLTALPEWLGELRSLQKCAEVGS